MSRPVTVIHAATAFALFTFCAGDIASAQEPQRIPMGLAVIELEAPPLTLLAVAERADAAFAVADADEDGTLDAAELRTWRAGLTPGDDETVVAAVAKIEPDDILALLDADGDGRVAPSEARALALYDAALLDTDGDGAVDAGERLPGRPPGLAVWAARPCLEFGVGEGMMLGAFCGR